MSLINTPQIRFLEEVLRLTSYRHTLIASNLANVDTPGYQTRDIHFEDELKNALSGLSPASGTPQSHVVRGLIERPDGNTVSADRESLLLADNQLRFRLGIELLRKEFQRLRMAINEGR
jgi:flagellar basal-body rod protein FlgB